MSTADEGAALLKEAAQTLLDRNAEYKDADKMYAAVMRALFPNGIALEHELDHHRYHLFMLMMVKVTRYARNWHGGHSDSLTDLACYAGMLASIDRKWHETSQERP